MAADPFSLLAIGLALYGIYQRDPRAVLEAAREQRASRQGETTPEALELRNRLAEAGFEVADTGHPFRDYLANVWRDYWVDQDRQRALAAADRATEADIAEVRSWWGRLDEQFADDTARRVNAWRVASPGPTTVDPDPDEVGERITVVHDDDYAAGEPEPDRDPGPIRVTVTVGDPIRRHNPAASAAAVADRPAPVRVAATVGDPTRTGAPAGTAPNAVGGVMSTTGNALATPAVAVTGVLSGAAEARSIDRALAAATAAYVQQLREIRMRTHALGESTVGVVQMSVHSRVVAALATAAEAAAAAHAQVGRCQTEVSAHLNGVAREFDRVTS